MVQVRALSTNYFQTNSFDYHAVPGTGATLVVSQTGALFVRVRDAAGQGLGQWKSQPLQISVEPLTGSVRGSWGGSATLRPDGTYLFTGVHPAAYVVKLLNTPHENSATVLAGETTEVTFRLP